MKKTSRRGIKVKAYYGTAPGGFRKVFFGESAMQFQVDDNGNIVEMKKIKLLPCTIIINKKPHAKT